MTIVEAWKYHHANVTDGKGNVVAPGASVTGQPTPTLNAWHDLPCHPPRAADRARHRHG